MEIVAFDGPERTGKSTQIKLLEQYLLSLGKKVHTMHTSVLNGKDVTHMQIDHTSKFYTYLASLQEATVKILRLQDRVQYVILDRYLVTHLVYSSRYWPMTFSKYNKLFVEDILRQLRGIKLTTIVLTRPYIKDKSYDVDLMGLFSTISVLPNTKIINQQGVKEEIHQKVKEALKNVV